MPSSQNLRPSVHLPQTKQRASYQLPANSSNVNIRITRSDGYPRPGVPYCWFPLPPPPPFLRQAAQRDSSLPCCQCLVKNAFRSQRAVRFRHLSSPERDVADPSGASRQFPPSSRILSPRAMPTTRHNRPAHPPILFLGVENGPSHSYRPLAVPASPFPVQFWLHTSDDNRRLCGLSLGIQFLSPRANGPKCPAQEPDIRLMPHISALLHGFC